MIKTKQDYLCYLAADAEALKVSRKSPRIFGDEIWKFEMLLRKAEYLYNTRKKPWQSLWFLFVYYRFKRFSIKLGIDIPLNVFGPGLSIAHRGNIVINSNVHVGANCRIHVGVNIGTDKGSNEAPVLGDNVYIGPGAKIFGSIVIADGIKIGANAVVNKSFSEKGISIGGIPAKQLSK